MGRIVGDEPCPSCRERGRDSKGDHLIQFEDGGAYCNRCGYTRVGKDGTTNFDGQLDGQFYRKPNTMAEFEEIKTLPIKPLEQRGIDLDTANHFRIRTGFNQETGKAEAYYYPVTINNKLVAYKQRKLPKDFEFIGEDIKGKPVQFFGQGVATPAKRLLIVEGQDDMLAAYQMLSKYKQQVVSTIHGTSIKVFEDNRKFLEQYEEIIFAPDNDGSAGDELTTKLTQLYPDIKVMSYSEKDANDMLLKGKQAEFVNAFFKAAPHKPDGFITVDDVFEEATRMPEHGLSYPWPSLTKLTYGMRMGEGMYIGAGVKIGKSNALDQIIHHVTQVHEMKMGVFKFEEQPAMTVRKIAGKIKHKQFHIPDGEFTKTELEAGVQAVKDSGVVLYKSYGYTPWDEVEAAVRYACVVEGVKIFAFDPLTRLTTGTASERNEQLEYIADRISTLAKDLGFFYLFFCHLNAPKTGKPHEEGGRVHSYQFTGSRAMMRAAYYFIGIERDKTAEDERVRNTSKFVLLEDRMFGNSGSFNVFYDRETGDYLEPIREFE